MVAANIESQVSMNFDKFDLWCTCSKLPVDILQDVQGSSNVVATENDEDTEWKNDCVGFITVKKREELIIYINYIQLNL